MANTDNFKDRITQVIDTLGENKNSFSVKIGLKNGTTVGRLVKGDRQPSFEILQKIAVSYPHINLNWLATGEGNMFNHTYQDLENFNKEEILDYVIMNIEDFKSNPKIDALYRILKSLHNQESLENMHDKIDELTKLVDELKKK